MGNQKMDNPETLTTFGTQSKGQRQTKCKKQHSTILKTKKEEQPRPHHKTSVNIGPRDGYAIPTFYKTPAMLQEEF